MKTKDLVKRGKNRLKNKAVQLRTISADDAWMYENARTLDVYIRGDGGCVSARLTRAQILDWLKRTGGAR